MKKVKLLEDQKKKKQVEDMINEFIKRSKELELQEEDFSVKALSGYRNYSSAKTSLN